jgi:hypothetical protein
MASDNEMCPDSSLTALRCSNLNVCVCENDYQWQITSIAIEKTLGFYLNKSDLIPLAQEENIPIEK